MPETGAAAPVVRVLIVDDQAPFRRAAATVCRSTEGFDVVAEAASGEEAVRLARSLAVDLVLMDINLPGISGIEATRQLVGADSGIRVVLLSTYAFGDLPADARTSGALCYVHKEELGPTLLRKIWDGETAAEWL